MWWSVRRWCIRSAPFFHPFVELCISSYPSPLEDHAPLYAKAILHAIAGGFEFVVASWIADLAQCICYFTFLFARGIHVDVGDQLLALLVFLRVASRARQFIRRISRQEVTLANVAKSFFWHSPSLLFYMVCLFRSKCLKSGHVRILTPTSFFMLLAPDLETAKMFMEMRSVLEITLWGSLSTEFLVPIVRDLILVGPSLMINITLFVQSTVYLSSPLDVKNDTLEHPAVNQQLPDKIAPTASPKSSGSSKSFRTKEGPPSRKEPGQSNIEPRDGQIRLLRLYPGTKKAPIWCSRKWYDIKSLPSYTAISYCWSSDELVRNIQLDHHSTLVTESAWEVLINLRSVWKTKYLWIDALCIDQRIDQEKAQQLPLMPKIYQGASEVVIWLGYSKSAELATCLIDRVFLITRLRAVAGKLLVYEIPTHAARALKEMLDLLWFQRVWVVQEVVQPRNRVTIRYGNVALSWQRFSWFTQSIAKDDELSEMLSSRGGWSRIDESIALRNVSMMRRFACIKDSPLSLLFYLAQIFRSSCTFQSSNPRDRVYALLGLSGLENIDLTPNYSISLCQLFIDVIKKSNEKCKAQVRLAFLIHAGLGYGQSEEAAGLPSWVPDWTIPLRVQPLLGTEGGDELLRSPPAKSILEDAAALASFAQYDANRQQQNHFKRALEQAKMVRSNTMTKLYNATPGTESQVNFLPNNILQLQGYHFDRVRGVGDVMPAFNNPTTAEKEAQVIIDQWFELVSHHSERLRRALTLSQRQELLPSPLYSLFKELIPGTQLDYTFVSAPEDIAQLEKDQNKRSPRKNLARPVQKGSLDIFAEPRAPDYILRQENETAQRKTRTALQMKYEACVGRCFAVTEKEHVGLFLPGTKPGDVVTFFAGGTVPFCLRSVGNKIEDSDDLGVAECFQLIGPVYLEGLMYGAAMTEGANFQNVEIC